MPLPLQNTGFDGVLGSATIPARRDSTFCVPLLRMVCPLGCQPEHTIRRRQRQRLPKAPSWINRVEIR